MKEQPKCCHEIDLEHAGKGWLDFFQRCIALLCQLRVCVGQVFIGLHAISQGASCVVAPVKLVNDEQRVLEECRCSIQAVFLQIVACKVINDNFGGHTKVACQEGIGFIPSLGSGNDVCPIANTMLAKPCENTAFFFPAAWKP